MKTLTAAAALVVATLALTSCSVHRPAGDGTANGSAPPSCTTPGGTPRECAVDGYADRPMDVYVPSSYAGDAMPVVIFLHGGGGNSHNAQATTCSDGDPADSSCLQAVGDREGFITVFANGYHRPANPLNMRTWNAGGGTTFACASGAACTDGSDDVAYVSAVIDQIESDYAIDSSRVYVVGFSDGAAMAHRVGCELSGRVAAIVAVSGANEIGADGACAPTDPVAVMHIHGTADTCWSYVSSREACADGDPLPKAGVAESTAVWVAALGCDNVAVASTMPDVDPTDGTTTSVATYGGCQGGVEVRILTVDGGGHVYPQGSKVREPRDRTDVVTEDFGNEQIWAWLSQWSKTPRSKTPRSKTTG